METTAPALARTSAPRSRLTTEGKRWNRCVSRVFISCPLKQCTRILLGHEKKLPVFVVRVSLSYLYLGDSYEYFCVVGGLVLSTPPPPPRTHTHTHTHAHTHAHTHTSPPPILHIPSHFLSCFGHHGEQGAFGMRQEKGDFENLLDKMLDTQKVFFVGPSSQMKKAQ